MGRIPSPQALASPGSELAGGPMPAGLRREVGSRMGTFGLHGVPLPQGQVCNSIGSTRGCFVLRLPVRKRRRGYAVWIKWNHKDAMQKASKCEGTILAYKQKSCNTYIDTHMHACMHAYRHTRLLRSLAATNQFKTIWGLSVRCPYSRVSKVTLEYLSSAMSECDLSAMSEGDSACMPRGLLWILIRGKDVLRIRRPRVGSMDQSPHERDGESR